MWDTELFLWLNFDGGPVLDALMTFASGHYSWIPLYVLILFLIYRRGGWRAVGMAVVAIALAAGLSDLLAGIFKHSGPLENLWADFPARLRPMNTPELDGLIHVLKKSGRYGTVSAHAATSVSVGLIATLAIRKRWFAIVMWTQVALVCYSRIYLASHFPQDILLGIMLGAISGGAMWFLYRRFSGVYAE